MSIAQAIVGAKAELATIQDPWHRLKRIASIAKLLLDALAGTVVMVPFGIRAMTLRASLPTYSASPSDNMSKNNPRVRLARDVKYGPLPRNTIDIYIPPTMTHTHYPVCLFCHGGVWATGETWHYTEMAHRLAQAGVLTVVMRYSLYPDALVPHMVAELSQALTWTFDHAAAYGGDPRRVSLVGHSAGAQLCAMALLHRAVEAARRACVSKGGEKGGEVDVSGVCEGKDDLTVGGTVVDAGEKVNVTENHGLRQRGVGSTANQQQQRAEGGMLGGMDAGDRVFMQDHRMPARFIGMAGVYDIAKHYEYETGRGVQELSTMKRAVGGYQSFAAQSPAVLLARAVRKEKTTRVTKPATMHRPMPPSITSTAHGGAHQPSSYYDQFPLHGEAISHRIGMERSWTNMALEVARGDVDDGDDEDDGGCLPVDMDAAGRLPPTVLMSSCTDLTVPWYESAEMFWMLHDCKVPVKHLVYDKVDHSLFVTGWQQQPRETGVCDDYGQDLPTCCGDLLRVATERVDVQYCR